MIDRRTFRLPISALAVAFLSLVAPEPGRAASPNGIDVSQFQLTVPTSAKVGDVITVSIGFKNVTTNPITLDANGLFVGCRLGALSCDFGHQSRQAVIQPGAVIQLNATTTPTVAGTLELWPAYHVAGHYGPFKWMVKTVVVSAGPSEVAPVATPPSGGPAYQVIKNPDAATPEYAVLQGLKIIAAGNFDGWVSTWCSPSELCFNSTSIASLKKYGLPAMQRQAPQCLKEAATAIYVTRVVGDPSSDTVVKVFVLCNPAGMPKPFTLIKHTGWKFKSL